MLPWPNEHNRSKWTDVIHHSKKECACVCEWNVWVQSVKADMHPASRAKHKKCMDPWICKGFSEDVCMFVLALLADENDNLHSPIKTNFIKRRLEVLRQCSFRWQSAAVKSPLLTVYQPSKLRQNDMSPIMQFHTLIGAYLVTSLSLTFAINCRALVFSGSMISKTKGSRCCQLRWHFFLYIL